MNRKYNGLLQSDYESAVTNRGNLARIKELFGRARRGERLTLGFLGGSITQGFCASRPELCYAGRVYDWWKTAFPQAEFVFRNAGIGATNSQFGCARAESDLLAYRPDFIVVEYAVNDASDQHCMETYEGLVRRLYTDSKKPALLLVHNMRYDDGASAERVHGRVARYYDLPAVSMRSSIYQALLEGRLENETVTPDELHPSDTGHELVASVITDFLERVLAEADCKEPEAVWKEQPLTQNAYEHSRRHQNDNCTPVLKGFAADPSEQDEITDIFKKGWTASEKGASIRFEVAGSCIGVQYRKTIQLPAPVADLILDGDEDRPFRLDANFDQTWGDKLELDTILEHGEDRVHSVEIRLTETHPGDKLPFYLVSVISG